MITRYHIFIVCALFLVLSAVLALFSISSQYRETYRLREYVSTSAVEERLSGVFVAMNDFPGSAGKDILFLHTLSSVTELYSDFSVEMWRRTHEDVQQFIERNVAYDEVYLHAPVCMFTVRRASEESGDTLCSSYNKIMDEVVTRTLELPQGSVYISPLIAYTRRVKNEESTIPAILYGTRISAQGSDDGVVVVAVNTDYFLEEVRRLARPSEVVYLVNTDGSYIAHPEREQEIISGGTANFYDDFPIPAGALSNESLRTLETDGFSFTFMRITPTASNFALYNDADQDSGTGYWVLVAVSEKNIAGHWLFSAPYLTTVLIVGIAHALVVLLLFAVLFPKVIKPKSP